MEQMNNSTQCRPVMQAGPAPVSSKIENALYGLRSLTHCFASHGDYETLAQAIAILDDAAHRVRLMERDLCLPEDTEESHASL